MNGTAKLSRRPLIQKLGKARVDCPRKRSAIVKFGNTRTELGEREVRGGHGAPSCPSRPSVTCTSRAIASRAVRVSRSRVVWSWVWRHRLGVARHLSERASRFRSSRAPPQQTTQTPDEQPVRAQFGFRNK